MNVLQVNPTNVYPPSDGGQHRSHGLVSAFPDHGDSVYRYCQGGHLENYLSGDLSTTVQITDEYTEFQHLHPVFDLMRSPELFGLPNVFLGWGLRMLKSNPIINRIDWADVILVELPWQMPAVAALAGTTPVVYSSHNVELERFESESASVVEQWFRKRVETLERAALETASLVVCTSNRDVEGFRRRFEVDFDSFVAPNGVSMPDVDVTDGGEPAATVRDRHGIEPGTVALFVGTDYGPNREAARSVLRMADQAARQGLDIHFLVVGSVCQSLSGGQNNVTLAGFVEDLEPYFGAADIGLNPIRSGSGTNIKLLEYLAAGLPVVTTSFGARGFEISHDDEALVVPDAEFLDAVRSLSRDPDRRNKLAKAGQKYVRRNHRWEQISADLRERLAGLR